MSNTSERPTIRALRALRDEAVAVGDMAQVLICDRALGDVVIAEDPRAFERSVAGFINPSDQARIRAMTVEDCVDACAATIAARRAQAATPATWAQPLGGPQAVLPAAQPKPKWQRQLDACAALIAERRAQASTPAAPRGGAATATYALLRGTLDNYRKLAGACTTCGLAFDAHTDGQLIRCANMEADPRSVTGTAAEAFNLPAIEWKPSGTSAHTFNRGGANGHVRLLSDLSWEWAIEITGNTSTELLARATVERVRQLLTGTNAQATHGTTGSTYALLHLSTAHLPRRFYEEGACLSGAYQHAIGMLLWVPDDPVAQAQEHGGPDENDDAAPEVLGVRERARALGCAYILFDVEGPLDPWLPRFEEA